MKLEDAKKAAKEKESEDIFSLDSIVRQRFENPLIPQAQMTSITNLEKAFMADKTVEKEDKIKKFQEDILN